MRVNWQSLCQCVLRSNKWKVGDRSCAWDWTCTFGAHTLKNDEELRWSMESSSRIYEFNPGGRWHDEVVAKSSFEGEILAWSNSWCLTASPVPKLLLRDMTLQCVYEWIHAGDRELYTYIVGFVAVIVVVVVAGEGGERKLKRVNRRQNLNNYFPNPAGSLSPCYTLINACYCASSLSSFNFRSTKCINRPRERGIIRILL